MFLRLYLEIRDDLFAEIKTRPTIRQQAFYMLQQWREESAENNRTKLASLLERADRKLHRISQNLRNGHYMV